MSMSHNSDSSSGARPTQSVNYKIGGMQSRERANALNARLESHRGVRNAETSFERGESRVVYEPALTDSVRIAEEIEHSGYRILDKQPWGC
jgi:copper chaperone CopZ